MPFLVQRFINKIYRIPFETSAIRTIQISPAENTSGPTALYFDQNLRNIQDVIPGSSLKNEMDRTLGTPITRIPTILREYEGVRISGEIICSGLRYMKYLSNHPPDVKDNIGYLESAFLSTNLLSGREFGHWLRDSLVSEIYGDQQGLQVVGLARKQWQHEPGYRALSGLACTYGYRMQIAKLTMLQDGGFNSNWAKRFLELRARMRRDIDASLVGSHKLVFIDRGAGGRRRNPANISDVAAKLETLGFRVIVPTAMAVEDIKAVLSHSEIAVSVEGSHLNHLHCFAPDGLKLITIQDPYRFSVHHKRVVDTYFGRFGIVVGDPLSDGSRAYNVDLDLLQRMIDMVSQPQCA